MQDVFRRVLCATAARLLSVKLDSLRPRERAFTQAMIDAYAAAANR